MERPRWLSAWIPGKADRGWRSRWPGGLARAGVKTRFAGIITTPGVAYLTRTGPFVAGVMISASHNPYQDNGLKAISHSGYKLPDEVEMHLEKLDDAVAGFGPAGEPLTLQVDASLDNLYTDYLACHRERHVSVAHRN